VLHLDGLWLKHYFLEARGWGVRNPPPDGYTGDKFEGKWTSQSNWPSVPSYYFILGSKNFATRERSYKISRWLLVGSPPLIFGNSKFWNFLSFQLEEETLPVVTILVFLALPIGSAPNLVPGTFLAKLPYAAHSASPAVRMGGFPPHLTACWYSILWHTQQYDKLQCLSIAIKVSLTTLNRR